MSRNKEDVRAELQRAEADLERLERVYDNTQAPKDLAALHEASRRFFRLRDEFREFLRPRGAP